MHLVNAHDKPGISIPGTPNHWLRRWAFVT